MNATVVVPEYGTRLQRHAVLGVEDGKYELLRWPGPDRPEPFRSPGAELTERLAAIVDGERGQVLPARPRGEGSRYVADHWHSPADALVDGAPGDLVAALAIAGRLVALIHDLPPTGVDAPPPGLRRLWRFLGTGGANADETTARLAVRRHLGGRRWSTVVDWCTEVLDAPDVVLCHGAPGLASMVVSGQPWSVQLLTGDDLSAAPWYWDVGWLVGECLELSRVIATSGPSWTSLSDAFVAGYGVTTREQVDRVAVLRILLHLHDFTAYVGWHSGEVRRYSALLAELIDTTS